MPGTWREVSYVVEFRVHQGQQVPQVPQVPQWLGFAKKWLHQVEQAWPEELEPLLGLLFPVHDNPSHRWKHRGGKDQEEHMPISSLRHLILDRNNSQQFPPRCQSIQALGSGGSGLCLIEDTLNRCVHIHGHMDFVRMCWNGHGYARGVAIVKKQNQFCVLVTSPAVVHRIDFAFSQI